MNASRQATPTTPQTKPSNEAYEIGYKGNAAQSPLKQTPQKLSTPDIYTATTFLGPTPQHLGRALGIFDITPEKSSPLINKLTKADINNAGIEERILETPTVCKSGSPHITTPGSVRTPSYFTFKKMSRTEAESPIGPIRLRRSLSSMMAELREMQNTENEGDSDILRELAELEDLEDEENDKTENEHVEPISGKAYKKKGQKRTTKRVKSMYRILLFITIY